MNDVIMIEQLPVIKESLISVKDSVIERTNRVKSLAVTEENRKEVKQLRADLNKESKAYKEQLKAVKQAIMQPYTELETIFGVCIGIPYAEADASLKEKIDSIEDGLKGEKIQAVQAYFEEYKKAVNNDFTTIKDIGLNITLSASLKSLKEAVKTYLDRTAADVQSITSMPNSSELLAEYKGNGCNLATAITTVDNRHKRIEDEKARLAELMAKKAAEEEAVKRAAEAAEKELLTSSKAASDEASGLLFSGSQKELLASQPEIISQPEVIAPPAEVQAQEQEPTYTTRFEVTGTLEQLKALKAFLVEGGYTYADI